MFARLPLLGFVVCLCLAGWHYLRDGPPQPAPVAATCRELADSPAMYAGKRVRVPTDHCVRDTAKTVVWRRLTHEEPAVVLRFPGPFGEPLPSHLTGTCHAPHAGGPVTVSDCR